MEQETCQHCIHFRQHYIKRGSHNRITGDGHCARPRLKRRRFDDHVCKYFTAREEGDKLQNSCIE